MNDVGEMNAARCLEEVSSRTAGKMADIRKTLI
jgi:hypothetical protein